MNIGFLYYRFYPVTGGASIHGYYLARELTDLGYKLFKINGEQDPYTTKFPQSVSGAIKLFKNSDVIYVRADYFLNFRNLLGIFALLSNKKVIVELNSPSDELHLFGKSKRYIRIVDRIASWFLKRADAIITVSSPILEFCEEGLNLENVFIIENGGEEISGQISASNPVKDKIGYINKKYAKRAVWSGSLNKMQDLQTIIETAKAFQEELAVIVITDEEQSEAFTGEVPSNLYIFRELKRSDVEYIIKQCQIGFAFYQTYEWSRWGFYNSSLKIFEFLNNDLLTITNIEGTETQRKYPNFKQVNSIDQIITLIRDMNHNQDTFGKKRTWKNVALETDKIIQSIQD